jgi:hypothetical protein
MEKEYDTNIKFIPTAPNIYDNFNPNKGVLLK